MKFIKLLILVLSILSLNIAVPDLSESAAPPRSQAWCTQQGITCPAEGRPYAESICNTDPNIIFCEDFNFADISFWSGTSGSFDSWFKNPAAANPTVWSNSGCGRSDAGFATNWTGQSFVNQSSVAMKPTGPIAATGHTDRIYQINWDPTKGPAGVGQSQFWLMTSGSATTYCNGLSVGNTHHIRFQVYLSADYKFPGGFPKPDLYNTTYNPCLDGKLIGFYPFEGYEGPTTAAYDGALFFNCKAGMLRQANQNHAPFANMDMRIGDAIGLRYNAGSDCNNQYAWFPGFWDNNGSGCDEGQRYSYNTLSLNTDTGDNPVACTFNISRPNYCTDGRIFRISRGRWYTFEIGFTVAPAGQRTGVFQLWIDGVRQYATDNLGTCSSGGLGAPGCKSVGYVQILHYHNGNTCGSTKCDVSPFGGQVLIDNLIISKSYIGPPGGSAPAPDTTAPSAPQGISVE